MITGLPIYAVVAIFWLGGALVWYLVAVQLGKQVGAESDGCLLGFANILLALTGGGIGFLIAPYPWAIGTSLAGLLLLPGVVSLYFWRQHRRG